MKRTTKCKSLVVGVAIAAALFPATAFAASDGLSAARVAIATADVQASTQLAATDQEHNEITRLYQRVTDQAQTVAAQAQAERENKLLAYDPAAIEQIGTQEQTGHTICCPSFSCAYADAVMDGTVHDHEYYTCSCCSWTDWGGGGSSNRFVGDDETLLREAYDQISAGRPTVIHVSYGYGEHWIALIGYQNASDPDHLSLDNFIALDPWDGAQITASDRFSLYGDGCEHISER